MSEYQKIDNPFKRDTSTHRVTEGLWSSPALEFTADCPWEFTEKVDGTNIRVTYPNEQGGITVQGKTDRAQLKQDLIEAVHASFNLDTLREKCASATVEEPIIFYGEGYGPGIQAVGTRYAPTKRFICFDVRVGRFWLRRGDVLGLGGALGFEVVPVVIEGTIRDAIAYVRGQPASLVARLNWQPELPKLFCPLEGVVGRPKGCDLFDRMGGRLIVKVKARDFGGAA